MDNNIIDESVIEIRNVSKNSAPTEAFKTLRTNLLYTDNLKVIALTSTEPDEGKTITTFNLATSFASMGKRVALVDCDLRRSSLRSYLMIQGRVSGVSENLTRQGDSGFVHPTNISNLFIVLSGKKPPNPSEILSSNAFGEMMDKLREEFDYVIIDTPPVTVVPDTSIIGRKVDGIILVVRNEVAKKKILKRAKFDLERNGGRVVGVVLNRVKKNQVDYSDYGYDKYY